ncbi:hypothetical protein LIER_32591 [Lithospermum erythrorhizon]|uniref:RNase H type-1 domain-containing protein n=1 Tax=Lithospermum erythrorhizon TaxID=34254 RepID=A0AAV3RW24_LITER
MKRPNSYKVVQKLRGCLTALNHFISKSGERNSPFFKNLRPRAPPVIQELEVEELNLSKLDWILFVNGAHNIVDGAHNDQGVGAKLLILGPQEETMEYALRSSFPSTNNEADYEAMIQGLKLVKSLGDRRVLGYCRFKVGDRPNTRKLWSKK